MLLSISKSISRSTLRCSKLSTNYIGSAFYNSNSSHRIHFSTSRGKGSKSKDTEYFNRRDDTEREFIQRYRKTEPAWGVDSECNLDPVDVYIPYVTEDMRAEIWAKHKDNPTEWPAERLSQHFGLTMERMRATLYIMKDREEQMTKQGVLEIAPLWNKLFTAYEEDNVLNTPSKLAEDFKIEEAEVNNILSKMKDHAERTAELEDYTKNMEGFLEDSKDAGADVTFRETPKSLISVLDKDDRFFPGLFRDDQYEQSKRALLKRIANETKAKVVPTVDSLFTNLSTRPLPNKANNTINSTTTAKMKKVTLDKKTSPESSGGSTNDSPDDDAHHFDDDDDIIATTSTSTTNTTTTVTDTEADLLAAAGAAIDPNAPHFSRFKYAFRDLSESSLASKAPTMIRTRSGGWREATPLEELNRSWCAKPDPMEMQTFGHKLDRFKDPDGDEERAKNIPKLKKLRFKAFKLQLAAEAEASKKK